MQIFFDATHRLINAAASKYCTVVNQLTQSNVSFRRDLTDADETIQAVNCTCGLNRSGGKRMTRRRLSRPHGDGVASALRRYGYIHLLIAGAAVCYVGPAAGYTEASRFI